MFYGDDEIPQQPMHSIMQQTHEDSGDKFRLK